MRLSEKLGSRFFARALKASNSLKSRLLEETQSVLPAKALRVDQIED